METRKIPETDLEYPAWPWVAWGLGGGRVADTKLTTDHEREASVVSHRFGRQGADPIQREAVRSKREAGVLRYVVALVGIIRAGPQSEHLAGIARQKRRGPASHREKKMERRATTVGVIARLYPRDTRAVFA